MRKLTLSLSLAFLSLSLFAQKAEIDAANQAFKNNDFKTGLRSADDAVKLLKESPTVSPEILAEFYYNAGQAAQKLGDIQKAANYYALLNRVETKPYFEAKNKDTKEKEYFFYQSVAEKTTSEGNYSKWKKKSLSPKYITKIAKELEVMANNALNEASQAFEKKEYDTAFTKFAEGYHLSKALGVENKLYLYYSALAGLQTEKFKKNALKSLQFLADKNYDGVQTTYTATNVASGQQVSFANQKEMDTQVKIGICKDPKVEKTKSIEEELYGYLVYGYYQTEEYDKGIDAAKKALQKYPSNDNISQLLSSMYYKSGKTDKFIAELQEKVNAGTASAIDYYNLAKMVDETKGDKATVMKYYKTAIEKDPNMTNAYINLALSIIQPEAEYVKLMNANLGSSAKEKKIYNENAAKRKKLYVEALPYLEKAYALDDKNPDLIKVLQTTYDVTGNDAKFMEMKNKLNSL